MRPARILLAAPLLMALVGCGTTQGVRYVYQDREFGVVGMPENTDRWPSRYRTRAETLMHDHFPEGFEIVRAEEVEEGSRTLTLEGSTVAELTPELPLDVLKVAKLGHTAKRSQADSLKIKECRIIYRRAPRPTPPEGDCFADRAELTPTQYLDPNAEARRSGGGPPGEAGGEGEGDVAADATK